MERKIQLKPVANNVLILHAEFLGTVQRKYWWLVSTIVFRKVNHKCLKDQVALNWNSRWIAYCSSWKCASQTLVSNADTPSILGHSCCRRLSPPCGCKPSTWLFLEQLPLLCIINSIIYARRCVLALLQMCSPMRHFKSRQAPVTTCYLNRTEGSELLGLSGLMGQMGSETGNQGREPSWQAKQAGYNLC